MADKSDKLTHCGSSQANESLNFIITTIAPKFKHFDGSESLNFRVVAGVAQKNAVRKYVIDVSTCIITDNNIYKEAYVLKNNRSDKTMLAVF